jgi:iron complex outermembrane receptor protein
MTQYRLLPNVAFISTLALSSANVLATEEATYEFDGPIEEIAVTGSHIRRKSNFDSARPLTTVGGENLAAIGAKTISDAIEGLTINTGAQNNTDIFTQNLSPGTGNINLRGLGVASTLVLLNGKRQVNSGIQTLDGVGFVDTSSLVPKIAIDRLEILKDGASATYGSDAVAGVANFFTRDTFEGVELSADYQFHASEGSQEDLMLEALYGFQGEKFQMIAAVGYFDRTTLDGTEVSFLHSENNTSALGNPGSYYGVPGAEALPVIDSGCTATGGIAQVIADSPANLSDAQIGYCRFDFGPNQTFVPKEERLLGFVRIGYDLSDTLSFNAEFGFAENEASRFTSPSYPFLSSPIVPSYHPENPYGADLIFFGRPYANGAPSEESYFSNNTRRASFELTGEVGDTGLWHISYTNARNNFSVDIADTVSENFRAALMGFGGETCDANTSTAGDGNCFYYNPFSSALDGTSELTNGADVYDYIIGRQKIDARSRLNVLDAVYSDTWFDLPGGAIGFAIGGQYRGEDLSQDFDYISNADGFGFLVGNPDFDGSRNTYAGFGELSLPVSDALELQLALRYEKGGSTEGTLDPKIAALYRVSDELVLRASYGTSYRAPSIFQSLGIQTSFQQVVDTDSSVYFVSIRSFGDEALEAETAKAYNLGVSWQSETGLELDLDYWHFDFANVLTQEAPQAIIDADPMDARITRSIGGNILAVSTNFINASLIETAGFDIALRYVAETEYGTFAPSFDASYVLKYNIQDPQAGLIEAAGRRNFRNFGSPTPSLRANLGLNWASPEAIHGGNIFVRYVSELQDDQNPGSVVADTLTLDAQYKVALDQLVDMDNPLELTLGALNLTRSGPPYVATNGNFETRVHSPWGTRIYVRLKTQF